MEKNCKMTEERLLDYIEGNLPADRIKAIEEHRKSCVRCDLLIKNFSRIWSGISERERVQISPSFWQGLQAKIQAVDNPRPLSSRIFSCLKMILRPAALTITLLSGIYFGYQMGNISEFGGDFSKNSVVDADVHGKVYVEHYFQDFLEIPTGSPAEFYLQHDIYK